MPTKEHSVVTVGGSDHRPTHYGPGKISIRDNNGAIVTIPIPRALYFPTSPVNVVSIGKSSLHYGDGCCDEETFIKSTHDKSWFSWDHGRYHRTILHPISGLPVLVINEVEVEAKSASYCTKAANFFCTFVPSCDTYSKSVLLSSSSSSDPHILMDEDNEFMQLRNADALDGRIGDPVRYVRDGVIKSGHITNMLLDPSRTQMLYNVKCGLNEVIQTTREFLKFADDIEVAVIPQTTDDYIRYCKNIDPEKLQQLMNPKPLNKLQCEWQRWHERLNHMPTTKMRCLADKGVLPRSFLKLNSIPLCPSCSLGGLGRRAWRTKDTYGHVRKINHATPGSLVCVDQLISSQPGLVPQSSGYLTASRIWACNIFYDVFSNFGCGYMMRNTSLDQTIAAKHAFERELLKHNVTVKAYRADNGRFADAGFKAEIENNNQLITFCGVGAHGQNGIVERHIGKVNMRGRIMLLHAKRFWPEAITHVLWPFAAAEAINMENNFTLDTSGRTPLQKLTATNSPMHLRDQHPWGCPVHVLEKKLQSSSKGAPKWEPRARIGVYLGRSPAHAGNVALVLNPSSGHVSPQFHVVFDDEFTLISALRCNTVPANWADLVATSTESVSSPDVDSSKLWFKQTYNDHTDPESGFDATFQPQNIARKSASLHPAMPPLCFATI